MEVKFFKLIWEDDPNKQGFVITSKKYTDFLKENGKTIKINKIVHRAGTGFGFASDSAYVYYDNIKSDINTANPRDRFNDLDLTGDD